MERPIKAIRRGKPVEVTIPLEELDRKLSLVNEWESLLDCAWKCEANWRLLDRIDLRESRRL